jgi:hypothetical protein
MTKRPRRTAHSRAQEPAISLPPLHRLGGSWGAAFASGVGATAAITLLMLIASWGGFITFSLPSLLGQALTGDTNTYSWIAGCIWHLINGGLLAILYVALFRTLRRSSGGLGALIGFAHWLLAGIVLAKLPLSSSWELAMTGSGHFLFWSILGAANLLGSLVEHLVFGWIVGQLYRSSVRAEMNEVESEPESIPERKAA